MRRWGTKRCCFVIIVALALSLPMAAFAQDGAVFLPILTKNFAPNPGAAALTSEDLIEEAEGSGAITHEQALAYRVYATFGDSRLPAAYRGESVIDSDALPDVVAEYALLTPATQAALAQFLVPPTEPDSWYWSTVSAQGLGAAERMRYYDAVASVRVWYDVLYPEDGVKAQAVAAAIDRQIVPALDAVMNRRWLSDAGREYNGGDGRLDIYLVPTIYDQGLAVPYSDCGGVPVRIYLRSDLPLGSEEEHGLLQVAAHEMMHAVQRATPVRDGCSSYRWLREALATWFMDYVYPSAQSEQTWAAAYLSTIGQPIDVFSGERSYGAYLYFQYLARQQGGLDLIRSTWLGTRTKSSLEALYESGAAVHWDGFARAAWNQGPITLFRDWDGLTDTVTPTAPDKVFAGVNGTSVYRMPTVLEHLSAQYYRIRFADDTARSVIFYNGLTSELHEGTRPEYGDAVMYYPEALADAQWGQVTDHISVQALIRVEGDPTWKVEDWTTRAEVGFCRDVKAERIAELVLIMTNDTSDGAEPTYRYYPPGEPPVLVVSDTGCWRWTGSMSRTYVPQPSDYYNKSETVTSTDIVWEPSRHDVGSAAGASAVMTLKLASGTATVNALITEKVAGGCTSSADGHVADLTGNPSNVLTLYAAATGGARQGAYSAEGDGSGSYSVHLYCPGEPEAIGANSLQDWLATDDGTAAAVLPLVANGSVMDGHYTSADGRYVYSWHFEAQREQ